MKKIALIALMFPLWLGAQNQNFVKNGDAEAGTDNWAPDEVLVSKEAAHSGNAGFKTLGASGKTLDAIPVDTGKTYRLSGFFKSADDKKLDFCLGLIAFDANGAMISCHNINAVPGTDTELAEACQEKDTVLKVNDAVKWGEANENILVTFNTDPSGEYKDLPNRNNISGIKKIEKKDKYWEITVAKECGKTLPAKTPVRLHMYGGTYIYPVRKGGFNSPEWVEMSGTIKGITKVGRSDSEFWPGTKSVRIFVLGNGGGSILFDDIKFEEVKP